MICLFVFAAVTLVSRGQQINKQYTLLWRISGKDLKQPSYLFGTMHVKDKRVFNFSDSVMLAIRRCDAFALEVHPDSSLRMLYQLITKHDTSRDLHKLLSEKEYEELARQFEKKHGYKMRDDIDPMLAESMMKSDQGKPGDKGTFIDAYLYGIARTMSKNIHGLENIEEQLTKLVGDTAEIKKRLEQLLEVGGGEDVTDEMVKLYSTGDLDKVWNYMSDFDTTKLNLAGRNKVMVGSMLKIMRSSALFTAVGAGHLPGSQGIIALLRKDGYTVMPVDATFTGIASKFNIDYDKMKWITHTDNDQGYSLDFPAEPLKTDIYKGLTTWLYPDIATGCYYGIYVLQKGSHDHPADRETVVNNIITTLAKNKTNHIISNSITTVNGLKATDIIVKSADGYKRMIMLVNNNRLYYIYMGNRLKDLHTTYADRFFNSFKSFRLTEKPAKDWIDFKSDTGAFTVKLPLQPTRIEKRIPTQQLQGKVFKINMFLASDTSNLMVYLVRYNDYPAGTYLADKEALFNSITKEFGNRATVIGEPKPIWKDGNEGREVNVVFTGGYHGLLKLFLRGNRTYLLLEQNLHEGNKLNASDPFFDSFTFLPYKRPVYVNFEPKGFDYRIKLPDQPQEVTDSTKDYSNYLKNWKYYSATSPFSGSVYSVEHYTLSKYYRATDVDSVYRSLTKLLVKYKDTLIRMDTINIGGISARDLVVQDRNTKVERTKRVLINGDNVVFIQAYLGKEKIQEEETHTFYNSLEITTPSTGINLSSSKAAKIFADLGSADTTVFQESRGALSYYKFRKEELPEVYTALQKNYPDDTTRLGVRAKLVEILGEVHDQGTLNTLQNLYNNPESKDILKSTILQIIPQTDSLRGYDTYLKLLTESRPLQHGENFATFRPLFDSLDYAAAHFQQIIPLTADSAYRSQIVGLASSFINKDKEEYTRLVKNNFGAITRSAYDDLAKFVASKDTDKNEFDVNTYKYFNIMGAIRAEPLTDKYTNYYLLHYPQGYYTSEAVIARINNDLPVGKALVTKLLDSLGSRYEIMEAYSKKRQMDRVPLKYKTQQAFGRLCLYKNIVSENDDEDNDFGAPEKLILLGSIMDKGSVYYAYKFEQQGREANATLIGIAGPFKPGSITLNFKRYYAYSDYKPIKLNWLKQAKAMIPELKAAYQLK